jgi:hypothetical protein
MSRKPQPLTAEELENIRDVVFDDYVWRDENWSREHLRSMLRLAIATIDAANARIAELEGAIVAFYRASESYNLAIETREDVKSLMGKANIVCDMLNNISDIGNAIAEAVVNRQEGE